MLKRWNRVPAGSARRALLSRQSISPFTLRRSEHRIRGYGPGIRRNADAVGPCHGPVTNDRPVEYRQSRRHNSVIAGHPELFPTPVGDESPNNSRLLKGAGTLATFFNSLLAFSPVSPDTLTREASEGKTPRFPEI